MTSVDMKYFKEVKFKCRIGSASDFCRIETKSVVTFPAILSNGWFIDFLMSNIKFIYFISFIIIIIIIIIIWLDKDSFYNL